MQTLRYLSLTGGSDQNVRICIAGDVAGKGAIEVIAAL